MARLQGGLQGVPPPQEHSPLHTQGPARHCPGTAQPLIDAGHGGHRLPSCRDRLPLCDYKHLVLNKTRQSIYIIREGRK